VVGIFLSRQVWMILTAGTPRLAIKTFSIFLFIAQQDRYLSGGDNRRL
jgi:hypothetical protein